jgi:hypothetical protein
MAELLNNPTEDEIIECINSKRNFHIEGMKQSLSVSIVEDLLENEGYKVRVKTKGREATLLIPVLNLWNAAAQVAHTVATYDPDWVIYKCAFGSKIKVEYFGGN